MPFSAIIPESRRSLTDEALEHLHAATSWEIVHRPTTSSTFPARIRAAHRALQQLQRDLALLRVTPSAESQSSSALLELRANARLLRSAITDLTDIPSLLARLPRIILPAQHDEPRTAAIATAYLHASNGEFSAPAFQKFVATLQTFEPLLLDELWNMAAMLKFILLESLLDDARILLRSSDKTPAASILIGIKSLTAIAHTDWSILLEPLIVFDATLLLDPAQTYGAMDFDSRESYRKRVAFIARYSNCSELQVAEASLALARAGAEKPSSNPRIQLKRIHVGYYLIDNGFARLAARTGFHPPLAERARAFIRTYADNFYITGIEVITLIFIAVFILLPLPSYSLFDCLLAALLLVLPAMQCAVDLVNNLVTSIFDPDPLPKLDFSNGIPAECATLVAVPTLLLNENQVRSLVTDLEVRFLVNRDSNLHFALLTDLHDSVNKPQENDSDPLVELAVQLMSQLNAKYSSSRNGNFILLHRHRTYNLLQGVWMGWERKRGKLLDLNNLLTGQFDAFPIKVGPLEVLRKIRYVLTLDSDTQLPRGTAARLIGTIAHPLHQAIIDPELRIVVAGYGILQPRVGVSVRSAARSRMAAIYSGQNGFNIYTRAISDAYQDLYGEGIYAGKGIYEVATLHAVLDRRFPRNSLLSHDLIEGAYARAGLATDIEVIDDYPSHLSAFNRRKHRWVRGDWQIAQWMFSRVPDESGRRVPSPISSVARWKIFDNLRRSLVEPFTFILFVAGWLGLPGGPLYWTVVSLLLLLFPTLAQFAFGLGRALIGGHTGSKREVVYGFWKAGFIALINLVFLPHQTLLSLDAIIRALVRRFITGQRLLEWETAAEAESGSTHTAVDRYLAVAPFVAIGVAILVYSFHHHSHALAVAAPILLLWSFANAVASWLNAAPREQCERLNASDKTFLLTHALRIWRYFYEFGGERHNYLIPDNVEEDGLYEAARVSPTNLGLLLNARQAACAFGFLTVPEFVTLTEHSLATVARLEKYRGHLYNWYDTKTLQPLNSSPFVSSVDSGNLVASLYTLRSGSLALLKQPLFSPQLFSGICTYWELIQSEDKNPPPHLPEPSASFAEWVSWLPTATMFLSKLSPGSDKWWAIETNARILAAQALLDNYTPWLHPQFAPLRELPGLDILQRAGSLSIEEGIQFAERLDAALDRAWEAFIVRSPLFALAEKLRASLPTATQNLRALAAALHAIAQQAESLAEETEFAFLVDPSRHILSIGYDVRARKLHDACYDMLASEARIATFLAVARGELPQQSWFKLGRDQARAFGHFLLQSWTGTMFEYLMPALWMRSYPDTLISRTLAASVEVQRAFARTLDIPWGISESGAARKDDAGHYHYQAYGIPQIALWIEANAGPVVSPYSTFLAVGIDSLAAMRNLRRMAAAGWVGAYGFYEAADYTETSGKAVLVREWMAHHQGMSLLAILNLLRGNAVQRWFHANPLLQATELVLHETPISNAVLKARLQE